MNSTTITETGEIQSLAWKASFVVIIFLCFLTSCGHFPCILRPGGLYSVSELKDW